MSKKLKNRVVPPTVETIATPAEVTNIVAGDRDVILAQIAELKKQLPPAQRGAKPVQFTFPNGKFTLRELATHNEVCYATAVSKMHQLIEKGQLTRLTEVQNGGIGIGRPKWLFQVPESVVA